LGFAGCRLRCWTPCRGVLTHVAHNSHDAHPRLAVVTAAKLDLFANRFLVRKPLARAGFADEALVRIAESLLEREILDGNEVMQIIKGDTLPPMPIVPPKDSADHTQQVLRPEPNRRLPGLSEGERPQPA
jgi:hypothetical protein